MNKTEFEKQKQVLKDTYEKELDKMYQSYALSNNSVMIGDIIEGNKCRIKVEIIEIISSSFTNKFPQCKYTGKKVTKKGDFFKDGSKDYVYQIGLKKINGVEEKKEN